MKSADSYIAHNYQKADRVMLFILWSLCILAFCLAPLHDTLVAAFSIGIPAALLPTLLILGRTGSSVTRHTVAAGLMVMSALHIHQAGGMIELHFGIFVLLAFLLCYRDWSVILTAAGVIALHHLSFNYLQEWGYGVRCFTEPGLTKVLIHAAYVVAEAGVLCYLAIMLQREAVQAAELEATVAEMTSRGSRLIDLSNHRSEARSSSGRNLNAVVATLHDAVREVRQGIEAIRLGTEAMRSDNELLASQIAQQAQSVDRSASAIKSISSTAKANAQRADSANEMAVRTAEIAANGGATVTSVVDMMERISKSSQKISEITTVVNDIAFQTNILALNAAVEAARAGDQGRGFAVVASEVRSLAQRSATAANDIKSLINDSVDEVRSGSALASQAGTSMKDIVDGIQEVKSLMLQLKEASQEQSLKIDDVSSTIEDISQTTQTNTASVDSAVASSRSMQEQAAHLASVVSLFKLGPS